MAITVKHLKVSTIPDAEDDSLVRPSDWNADHTLEGLGTMAEQDSDAVNITGGTIVNVSIPAGDISGLGTMATQDADDVAITGGTIDDVSGDNPDMSVGTAETANNLAGGEAGQIAVQTGDGETGFTSTPTLDELTFSPTPTPTTFGEGSVRYDETAKALIYYNSTSGNAITMGYNTQARVSNVTANTITKGMIVYAKASASIGGAVQVEPAIATSYDRSKVFGVATQDILPDEDGFVVTYGLVDGVDTSAWIQGTALYLSAEDEGEFIDEEPLSPDWTIHMGWVTRSLVDGQVFVKGENYSATPERFVGTLEVPNGGSGAVTLSGWLKGNGTSPFTAEDMIPLADIDGAGTMASQNSDDVAITGGEISGMDSIGTSGGGSITGDTLNISTLRPPASGGIRFNTSIDLTVYRLEGHDFIFEDNTNVYYTGNTGYVKANDSSPSTYSDTIPNTDIDGLGNMSIQDSDAVSISGGTITGMPTPTADSDVATKGYVDAVAQGLNVKNSVRAGTTANITLFANQTIDGVALTTGDRVLVKNQSASPENGIYVVQGTNWTRAIDADTWDELVASFVFIEEGTTQADTGWVCTSNRGGTLGVTPVTWVQFSAAGAYTAGTGLTLSGNQFSITNTAVTAGAYGAASKSLTATVNAQGQLTALAQQDIAISPSQITGSPNQVIYANSTGVLTGDADFTFDGTNVTTANDVFVNGMRVGHGAANVLTNSVVGADSLESATTGANNTAFGYQALKSVTTGSNLTAFGYQAGYSTQDASEFTAFGYLAAYSNTTGHGLSAFGYGAGKSSTTGWYNSYIGGHAGENNAGEYNTVVGGRAMFYATTGNYNTIVGADAALYKPSGSTNTGLGYRVLDNTGTGSGNVALGAYAGLYETGSNAFYVNNQDRTDTATEKTASLMYGTFNATPSSQTLAINAATSVTYQLTAQSLVVNDDTTLGGSNTDNLAVNARITTDLEPASNNAKDIGTSGRNWRDGYFGRNLNTVNLAVTGTTSFDGSEGTSGQVLTSNGTGSTPSWQDAAGGVSITDDTTTNATRYPLFANQTSGTVTTEYVSSTKYTYNPSLGTLTAPQVAASNGIVVNSNTVSASYTIPSGSSAMSAGPMTVASGQTVTVSSGSRWVIL